MLVVCSDIHVLESPLMSLVVTRMHRLQFCICVFTNISGGYALGPSQWEAQPPPAPTPARPGASASVLGPKPWSPSTFQLSLRPCPGGRNLPFSYYFFAIGFYNRLDYGTSREKPWLAVPGKSAESYKKGDTTQNNIHIQAMWRLVVTPFMIYAAFDLSPLTLSVTLTV